MTNFTYGYLPYHDELVEACSRVSPETGEIYFDITKKFNLKAGKSDADTLDSVGYDAELSLSFAELRLLLKVLVKRNTDESLDLASSIFSSLGVRWI